MEKSMLALSRVWTVLLGFLSVEEPSIFESYSYHKDEDTGVGDWQKVSLLDELRDKYIYKLTRYASTMENNILK